MSTRIPVTVIGGYLGAGKTTLINHLLRHAGGRHLAVLVNDFGALPIDADLIEAQEGSTISISGGCVCCSFGSDLVAALRGIVALDPPPGHLLIEASGVALPAAISATASLVRGLANEGIVVLADAETVRERAGDRYLGDTIERQLRDAGLILLSKPDLANADALAATRAWLEQFAPVIDSPRGQVPLEVALGPALGRSRPVIASPPAHPAYETVEYGDLPALDLERLCTVLTDPAAGVLRAKGIVRDPSGAMQAVQTVGRRAEIYSATAGGPGRLVCIGIAGRLDRSAIERAIAPRQFRCGSA